MKRPPIELLTLAYIVAYIPYIALTRWLSSTTLPGFAQPLRGLEIIPVTVILSGLMLWSFFWVTGWWRAARQVRILGLSVPMPTRWTLISGIATAVILVSVPLSYTFKNVSIPFVQLLMRGDILIVAPLVDMVSGRKVRWYSWAALILTAAGLAVAVQARGDLNLPMLCWVTIGLYTLAYFTRLAVMTRIAKSGAPREMQRYYVEEQVVGAPLAVGLLALLSLIDFGDASGALRRGFVEVWTSSALLPLAAISVILFVVSILAATILLDRRENTYCVPLERSASILAGIAAAYGLALWFGQKPPTQAEMIGAALLVLSICILTLGPRLGKKPDPAPVAAAGEP